MTDNSVRRDHPDITLTQLEEEPLNGFFGCTQSELVATLRRAIFVWAVAAALLALLIFWAWAMIAAMPIAGVFFMRRIYRVSALREGKPLYFHRHVEIFRSGRFIQPAPRYQIERNSR